MHRNILGLLAAVALVSFPQIALADGDHMRNNGDHMRNNDAGGGVVTGAVVGGAIVGGAVGAVSAARLLDSRAVRQRRRRATIAATAAQRRRQLARIDRRAIRATEAIGKAPIANIRDRQSIWFKHPKQSNDADRR